MADWSALAGFAGLASALSDIQDRRVREAQLQRQLTEGQGEWALGQGRGGALGVLDKLFGYNQPGQVGFGGQTYQFQPYAPMTAADVTGLGLTYPDTTTTPAYEKPLPPNVQGPLELVPEQQTTTEVPLPGFVGRRLDPKLRDVILQEKLKERFERFKMAEQGKLFDRLDAPGGAAVDTGGAVFDLPGTGATAPTTQAPPVPPASAQVPAPQTPGQPSTAQAKPFGTPTQEMADAIADAHRLYPQVRPELITAIMAKESNFDVRVTSPKGAQGLMQLMPATQKAMGVDDPFDIRQNVRGGTRYFAQLLARYGGNEALALAAYNAGPGPVDAAGKQIPNFPETRAYVPAVLGLAKPGAFASPAAPTQAQAPAAGQTLPPGSVQVAGPGALTPPTATSPASEGTQPTSGTVPLSPQEPFALTAEGQARIQSNNRRTLANNQRLQALDVERRRVQAGVRAGMPGMTDRLNALEASVRALRLENTGFYDDSQKVLGTEQAEWRSRLQRREERRQRPAEVAAEERAREEEKERFRQGQNLYDAVKDDATLFRDTITGQPVDETQPYRDVQVAQKRKGAGGVPQVVRVSKEAEKRLDVLKEIEPAVQQIRDNLAVLYGPGGPLRGYERGVGQTANLIWEQIWQSRPELQAMRRNMEGQLQNLARAFGGARGDLNAQELEAARGMISQLGAKLGFEITFGPQVGTRGLGVGFGIKLAPTIPDSADVGTKTMNEFLTSFNQRIGAILRNPKYSEVEPLPMPERLTQTTRSRLLDMTPAQIRSAPAEALADVKTLDELKGTDFTTEQKKAIALRLKDRLREQAARVDLPTGRPRIPGLPPGRWQVSP